MRWFEGPITLIVFGLFIVLMIAAIAASYQGTIGDNGQEPVPTYETNY